MQDDMPGLAHFCEHLLFMVRFLKVALNARLVCDFNLLALNPGYGEIPS